MGYNARQLRSSGLMNTRMFFRTQEPIVDRAIPGFPDARKYQFYLKVTDIPEELSTYLKVNPRRATPTKVHTGIIKTCLKEPKMMVLRNAGLILSAKSGARVSRGLNFEFDDPRKHGLIDGNNSRVAIATACARAQEESISLAECFVEVTIYLGLTQGQVQDVASGQNIRKPVQQHSLLHYLGYFEDIKRSLGRQRCENISFFEGDDGENKDMKINFLLQLMMSLNLERYPDGSASPQTYAHAGKVLRDFQADSDEKKPSIMLLSEGADKIYDAYLYFKDARENLWRGIKGDKGGSSKYKTVDESSYAAIDLQFFAALRPLVVEPEAAQGQFAWKLEPSVFIPEVGPVLIERIKTTYDEAPKHKRNDTVGKSTDLAEVLYERASRWLRNRKTA
jgi:AIPR protein